MRWSQTPEPSNDWGVASRERRERSGGSDGGPNAKQTRRAHLVRLGGIVVFHEADWRGRGSDPPAPLFDHCCRSIIRTFEKVGTNPYGGRALHATFLRAGLPAPTMALSALIGGGTNSVSGIDMLADLAITMAPVMERHGVIAHGEIDPATYRLRVIYGAERLKSVVVGRSEVGAWSHVA